MSKKKETQKKRAKEKTLRTGVSGETKQKTGNQTENRRKTETRREKTTENRLSPPAAGPAHVGGEQRHLRLGPATDDPNPIIPRLLYSCSAPFWKRKNCSGPPPPRPPARPVLHRLIAARILRRSNAIPARSHRSRAAGKLFRLAWPPAYLCPQFSRSLSR